jgi:large conductance mechanosensitive channel
MKMLKEFWDFAVKGNAFDLAIGFIIGAAFGKIVSSIVNDIIMPPIGALLGGVTFTSLKLTLKPASIDAMGKSIEAVTLNYGNFLQTTLDFMIIALCVFMLVKMINNFKKREEDKKAKSVEPTPEVRLLGEIRDLLKK